MESITLNVKDVFLACKKAFDEGRLSAFANDTVTKCAYRDNKGFPCAIGAGISDEDVKKLATKALKDWGIERAEAGFASVGSMDRFNELTVGQLSREGYIKLKESPGFDAKDLTELQRYHDDIVHWPDTAAGPDVVSRHKEEAKARFIKYLNKKLQA
jgi:hypothetical protein